MEKIKRNISVLLVVIFCHLPVWSQTAIDSSKVIRVLTFNILHGATTKGDFDLDQIAKVIIQANPDFVAMQEVDFKTNRARRYDLATELGWRTKMTPIFGKAMNYDGGEYGEAILSRYSLLQSRNMALPFAPGNEPRAALDLNSRQELIRYLESLVRELDIPLIYVSHSPDEVARLADNLALMEAGRIIATGPIGDMLDLPLAQGSNAEALIEASVAGHDDVYHLTYLDFNGGRFTVIRKELPVGSKARLRVTARDVSLTLAHQSDTSILNIFPATVDELVPSGDAQVTVRLLAGDASVLARVTRKSAALLDLKPGKQVYAQAKSVAVLS